MFIDSNLLRIHQQLVNLYNKEKKYGETRGMYELSNIWKAVVTAE